MAMIMALATIVFFGFGGAALIVFVQERSLASVMTVQAEHHRPIDRGCGRGDIDRPVGHVLCEQALHGQHRFAIRLNDPAPSDHADGPYHGYRSVQVWARKYSSVVHCNGGLAFPQQPFSSLRSMDISA